MEERDNGKNWKLMVGLLCLGLTALSVIASAETGSPTCQEKVNGQVKAFEEKNGRHPSNIARENMLVKCSEAEVGLTMAGIFARHSQESPAEKEIRCETSAKFARETGLETGARSHEELVQLCMSLPSEHEAKCGFPREPDQYFVVENQQCVTKTAGLTGSVVAKAEPRAHKGMGVDPSEGSGEEDPNGTSAQ